MANEETWNKNFNRFNEKHYKHFKVATGSRKALLTLSLHKKHYKCPVNYILNSVELS